jgi:hypothetical protein
VALLERIFGYTKAVFSYQFGPGGHTANALLTAWARWMGEESFSKSQRLSVDKGCGLIVLKRACMSVDSDAALDRRR